jgi:predicted porin
MKQIALVAALTAAFAGSAFAQSSVTLYGRINTSLELQKFSGESEKYVMQNNASRWGLRGEEDLGGGLSAYFQLEAGFGSDTGAGTANPFSNGSGFNRDAYVGLKSKDLGQIKMGRFVGELYYGTLDWVGFMNHDTGTSSPDNLWLSNAVYYNNAVQYLTPSFGGLVVSGVVSAGEGSTTQPKAYEIAATYDQGPLHLGAGYGQQEYRSGEKDKSFSAAVSYTIGDLTLGANWERNDLESAIFGSAGQAGTRDHVYLTGMYVIGALELHAGYQKADDFDNIADSGAQQYAVGVNYNLSKRTKVYAFFTKTDNDANAGYVSGTNGVDFRSFAAFGIRHNF